MRRQIAVTSLGLLVLGFLGGVQAQSAAATEVQDFAVGGPYPVGAAAPFGVAVDAYNGFVWTANSGSGSLAALDEKSRSVVATVQVGQRPFGLAFDKGNGDLYVANATDNTVTVVDSTSKTAKAKVTVGQSPEWVAVDSTTHKVYVTNWTDRSVSVIDDQTNSVVATWQLSSGPAGIVVDPSTHEVFTALTDQNQVLALGAGGENLGIISTSASPVELAMDPGLGYLYVGAQGNPAVQVYDVRSRNPVAAMSRAWPPEGIGVDPLTHIAYVADYYSNTVAMFDGRSLTPIGSAEVGDPGSHPSEIDVDPSTHTAFVSLGSADAVSTLTQTEASPADTMTPVVKVPSDTTVEATGPAGAVASFDPATAVDAVDGPVPASCDHSSGDTFPLGVTTVTCSATDKAGNKGTASFKVTVADTTAPVVSVPNSASAVATSAAGGSVGYSAVTATDLVDGPVAASCDHNPGETFPLGSTTITCVATDKAGNRGTGTLKVTVGYRWDGFLQPINDTAHQVGQSLSVFRAGSTVPVKFQIKYANGTVASLTSTPMWIVPQQGGTTASAVDESVYTDPADSGTLFRASGDQWIYNWKTDSSMAGHQWRVGVRLADGKTEYVVIGLR